MPIHPPSAPENEYSSLWQAAVLGVDRLSLPPGLQQMLLNTGLTISASADDALLQALAAWRLWQKAGVPLVQLPPTPPPPAPSVAERSLSSTLQDQLQTLLKDPALAPILPEFLALVQAHGMTLAGWQVPTVAAWALEHPELHLQLGAVWGNTGRWLLAQHPRWRSLVATTGPQEPATSEQREQWFAQQRQLDPAAARDWLATGWAGESPESKVALLGHFQEGLSTQDLPFLLPILADRRREVRQMAADVVARIPGNPLVEKYWHWLQALIQYHPLAPTRTQVFQLRVPTQFLPEWRQWGVEDVKNKKNHDAGVAVVFQLLRRLPPTQLAQYLQLSPEQMLAVVDASPQGAAWIQAILDAVVLHQPAGWPAALLDHWLRHSPEEGWNHPAFQHVLNCLPTVDFQRLTTEYLAAFRGLLPDGHLLNHLLQRTDHSWTTAMAQTVLQPVLRQLESGSPWPWGAWHYLNILQNLALQAPPVVLNWLEARWNENLLVQSKWSDLREKVLQTLRFRAQMEALFLAE